MPMEPEVLGPILEVFRPPGDPATKKTDASRTITPETVYQAGNENNRSAINKILDKLVLPDSLMDQAHHLDELYALSASGVV